METGSSSQSERLKGIALTNSPKEPSRIDSLIEWIKDFHWRHHETRMRVIDLEFQMEILKARCDDLEEKLLQNPNSL